MEKITFRPVYNRKNELLPNGTALIQIEAYLKPKKKYFSTKIYIAPEQWDRAAGKIKSHQNKISLNKAITKQIAELEAKAENIKEKLSRQGKIFSLDYLTDKNLENDSFIDFCRKNSMTEKMKQITRLTHTTFIHWLEKFKKDVKINDITFEFLKSFENYLRKEGLHQNTIAKNQAIMKRYVNLAIDKDLLDINKYPFRKYKIEKVETHREYLTPEELGRFEAIQLEPEQTHLQLAHDKFIFAVYTGLRYGDLHELKPSSLVAENGDEYLKLITSKTNQEIKLPIYLSMFNKALNIFYKYASMNNATLFKHQYNNILNKHIKELAKMAGINKKVTFHVARHTQATILLYKGVNITTVQKLLGHKKLETTQIYAKVMNETIKKELENIISFSV